MPTARPRYQITDTGVVREMLDHAAQRWPDVRDRKTLLLRLAEAGAAQFAPENDGREAAELRARQLEANRRSRALLDAEYLLSDAAWK